MKVIRLDREALDAFLVDRRLGILALHRPSGGPMAIPLSYVWDGERATMVSGRRSAKVRWLQSDPQAALLVTNVAPEPPRWVSLEGKVSVEEAGDEAVQRLADRYLRCELHGEIRAALQHLQRADLVQITLTPERIRTYAEVD